MDSKKFFFLLLFSASIFAQSQMDKISAKLAYSLENVSANDKVLVWIFFTDKGKSSQALFKKPELLVSKKSLERRAKVLNGNLVDETDLPVNDNYITEIKKLGIKVKHKTKWLNGISAYADAKQIEKLLLLPFVKKVDLVAKFKRSKEESKPLTQNDFNKLNKPQGPNTLNYGASFTQLNQINVPAVHDLGYTGENVTICVLDAGFNRLSHEVFSSMKIIAAWDFVNNDGNVGDEGDMGSGSHGTGTLSVIGGFKEGQLIGPAFNANYILAKTENTDSETPVEEDNWIAAVEWADSIGVDVTSTSLAYLTFDPPFSSYTWQDMDGNTAKITIGADLAVKKGIVVVNSASNDGFNPDHNTLNAPADGDSVIAVGAVNSSGKRASFSSVGNTVDGRTKPDVMAMGLGVYTASPSSNTLYQTSSGTSFSCPLAAGVAALILSKHPNYTPMQVRDAMRNTASNASSPDREMGWGILNALDAINYNITSTEQQETLPSTFELMQNYPNPFNPSTIISWQIPNESFVSLKIYNVLGKEVANLINEVQPAGEHKIIFNANDFLLSSGVYFYQLRAGSSVKTKKMILNK